MNEEMPLVTVWHPDQLPQRFPGIHATLGKILEKHDIAYTAIPCTRDIWCRDYMPVRSADGSLVQFVYWPRYLRKPAFSGSITTPGCYHDLAFSGRVRESVVILDGGGVEICCGTGIVTERVFADNYWYPHEELAGKLKATLKLERLIVIPVEPGDETGHVDGVVRFVNEQRVVLNDYTDCTAAYGRKVERLMLEHGLRIDKLPYAPTDARGADGMPVATGCYINFLRVDNLVILPQFGIAEDRPAEKACQAVFGENVAVEVVDCSELARSGGVLNCVSWQC